jgi:HNH endonuclease/AP2 domain
VRKVELIDGSVALVDDEDFGYVSRFQWEPREGKTGIIYAVTMLGDDPLVCGKGFVLSMHRMVTNAPRGVLVDHRDRDGLNNQKSNLRFATRSQNGFNQQRRVGLKTSRFKGVSLDKRSQKWRAILRIHGVQVSGGSFSREEEAARRYDELAKLHCGKFARCNF